MKYQVGEAGGATAEIQHIKVAVFPDGRVDRKNAAAFLGREPKTLAEWHSKGIGPRGFLVGGRVFYRWDEVQAFARGQAA
ncbi:MAG: helix-turn-helix transcriptional regulator [Sphingomicrobium sp.]